MQLRSHGRASRRGGGDVARLVRRIAPAVIVVGLLCTAHPAAAAGPVANGIYVGECCGGDLYDAYAMVAELRVGSDGRTLRGGRRGSYIGCDQDGTLLALRPGHRVRVRNGSFSFSGRSRRHTLATGKTRVFSFTVRGRFGSPDTARIVYSVRPKGAGFGCRVGPRVLRLHRRADKPPFIGCASQPGTTIISSPEARVYEQRSVFGWGWLPFAYGCLYSGDRRVAFGLDGFDERGIGQSLENFRLAGRYVAFGCGGNLSGGCWVGVRVVDLRDGSERSPSLDTSLGGSFGAGVGPSDVELKDNGSVAWIAGVDKYHEVGALDINGQRLLDSGNRIQPDSLMIDGSTLTWRKGDQLRVATLD